MGKDDRGGVDEDGDECCRTVGGRLFSPCSQAGPECRGTGGVKASVSDRWIRVRR